MASNKHYIVSKSQFYRLCKAVSLKYRKADKQLNNNRLTVNRRGYFIQKLIGFLNKDQYLVCFFDITGVNDCSFNERGWSFTGYKPKYRKQFTYNLTHILSLMTATGDSYFEFLKGTVINYDIINFLQNVFSLLNDQYPTKTIIIVLDNAKMHKTVYFKNFAINNNIVLLYTVSNHPMLNPIEYLFRFLKKPLQSKNSMK